MISTYMELVLKVWSCLPKPEIDVLIALIEGFLVPGSAIPEGEIRAPFEAISPAWAGERRLAAFEALWQISYIEIEIEGIQVEVGWSQVLPVIPLSFMLGTDDLPFPDDREPCSTRPFPR